MSGADEEQCEQCDFPFPCDRDDFRGTHSGALLLGIVPESRRTLLGVSLRLLIGKRHTEHSIGGPI